MRYADVDEKLIDPDTKEETEKKVFMVFLSGSAVRMKVAKICDAFNANRYSVPEDHASQMAAFNNCKTRLNDLEAIMYSSSSHRLDILRDVSQQICHGVKKLNETWVSSTLFSFEFVHLLQECKCP